MMANTQEVRRRRYSDELKQQVRSECERPGASVAKVAMSHGINANIVHTWRKRARQALEMPETADTPAPTFVPMMLPPPVQSAAATMHVHLQINRGPIAISVTWPMEAAAQLGIWTRELLK